MALGFVLINTSPTYEHEVYSELLREPKIFEVYPLFGEFDFITKIEADNFEKLGEIIVNNIRSVKGVTDTKTLTVIKSFN